MAIIYYTVNGDDDISKIQEIEKDVPVETFAESTMALDFLAQDITEVEYEKSCERDDACTEFTISLWDSEKTQIIHNYIGFVRFTPYFVVRKTS